jgi:putative intracellular protease/amidase
MLTRGGGVQDINPAEVKALVVPGGFCTDRLRRFPECNKLVHDAAQVPPPPTHAHTL